MGGSWAQPLRSIVFDCGHPIARTQSPTGAGDAVASLYRPRVRRARQGPCRPTPTGGHSARPNSRLAMIAPLHPAFR